MASCAGMPPMSSVASGCARRSSLPELVVRSASLGCMTSHTGLGLGLVSELGLGLGSVGVRAGSAHACGGSAAAAAADKGTGAVCRPSRRRRAGTWRIGSRAAWKQAARTVPRAAPPGSPRECGVGCRSGSPRLQRAAGAAWRAATPQSEMAHLHRRRTGRIHAAPRPPTRAARRAPTPSARRRVQARGRVYQPAA